jgi:phage/plasmid-like protein (TIGR03299 family)
MTAFALQDQLNWEVAKRRICVIGADGNFQPIEGKMATVREDNDKVLGIVSDDYEVLANSDLKKLIQPLVDEQVLTVTNQGYLNHGRKVFVQAEVSQDYEVAGFKHKGLITLLNSHDGTTKVAVGPTCVRVICQNTFALAMTQLGEKFRHSSGVTEKVLSSQAVINFVNEAMQRYSERVETLASTSCSAGQFQQVIEQVTGKDIKSVQERMVSTLNNLFYNGKGNEGRTMADAFQAFTEYASNYARKTPSGNFLYSQFGKGASTNTKAMSVLAEMAAV